VTLIVPYKDGAIELLVAHGMDETIVSGVGTGVTGGIMWASWAALQLAAGRLHTWRVLAFALLSGASLALELLDFPPARAAWDAHALWHLSTAPLPLLFYRSLLTLSSAVAALLAVLCSGQ
jgi:hypothetical protein